MNDCFDKTESQSTPRGEAVERRRLRVSGRVQGVGFRPFVYRLAHRLEIDGAVWNDSAGVVIEGQATRNRLDQFVAALRSQAPAAASVRGIVEETVQPHPGEHGFEIHRSDSSASATAEISSDLAVCPQCLAEIRDPANSRRNRYALTNCTNCGPRFSIIREVPYDRPNTTMADFDLCKSCRLEYEDHLDRRFHAQPTACRDCGPSLQLIDSRGQLIDQDPIDGAVQRLVDGKIVAVKGLGGYHLAVRADNQEAVARLRSLKHRPAKPFAVMCATLAAAQELVNLSSQGVRLLTSPAAPIVLATRRENANVADAVAPGCHRIGVMLAYTPLHHLIFDKAAECGIRALVMTSGNDVDEPLVFEDEQVVVRLGGLSDAILRHNRPIQRAVDDSVVIDTSLPIIVRRSRGYVPEPIALPSVCANVDGLAVGAEMKCTVAVRHDRQLVLSQHLGNLTQARSFDAFKRAIADMRELFDVNPKWIAHDLHPVYLSTQYARHLAEQLNVPLIGVQHHHAHAAAVLAEHGLTGSALAVVCDGTGYGTDGTIWGGELLVADLTDFRRLARLRPMQLPGGDAASRMPWRCAISLLQMALGDDFAEFPIDSELATRPQIEFIRRMLLGGVSCVESSSTGRVFDGIAALLGICRENRFDAEAPSLLEAAAAKCAALSSGASRIIDQSYRLGDLAGLIEIDLSPLVRRIAHARPEKDAAGEWALRFHRTLAEAWVAAVDRAALSTGLKTVCLSGGVFCNELFGNLLSRRLEQRGLNVLRHRQVSPNDSAISLGQAAVAAARWAKGMVSN